MADLKTKPTNVSPDGFLADVPNPKRREDGKKIMNLLREVTGEEPVMWGPSIIGFGSYKYRYDSGREGVMCRIGFSPRKAETVLYVGGLGDDREALINAIGDVKQSVACIYVKRVDDLDMDALRELFRRGWTGRIESEVTD
ncbi:MAG: DUF1801 domain-containing protein [Fimbriimonadaceae bacterium]|nr:DUF1801 domain-containing protein [Fimbriimonadaceae bacterium]